MFLGDGVRLNKGKLLKSTVAKNTVHKKKKSLRHNLFCPVKVGAKDANATKKGGSKKKKGIGKGMVEKGSEVENEQARKAEIKQGKRPMGALSQNVSPQVSDSFSDSHIRNMNRSVLRSQAYSEANKIWEVGKKIGLATKNNVVEIIQHLVDMELRDKSLGGLLGQVQM